MYVINSAILQLLKKTLPVHKVKQTKKLVRNLKMMKTTVFLWFMSAGDEDGDLVISEGISQPDHVTRNNPVILL